MFRPSILHVVILAVCGFSRVAMPDDSALSDLIEHIALNEKSYVDLDVELRSTYDIGKRKSVGNEITSSDATVWYVSQGDWFRVERNGRNQDSGGGASLDRIRAYDGTATRTFEQGAVGNISQERLEDENLVSPHMLVLRHTRISIPLSVYLSGDSAIKSHRNGRLNNDLTVQVTYLGDGEFEGLKCLRVLLVNAFKATGDAHDGREIWIAKDRNYIPVKEVAYTYRYSRTIPVGQTTAREFKEIGPGIWFPHHIETVCYNMDAIEKSGAQTLQWRERHFVNKVSLDPKYDRDFFSSVAFPDGTTVHEVSDGKIRKSYRVGRP